MHQSELQFFGLGYVGTVTAVCLSSLGNSVVGVDVDVLKLRSIQEADLRIGNRNGRAIA